MLGAWFDQPVNNLPETLLYLILGACFDQKVNNLPKNLKFLIIDGCDFKKKITNLPNKISFLYKKNDINCNKHYLPSSIKYSNIFAKQKRNIENLPNSFRHFNKFESFRNKFFKLSSMKRCEKVCKIFSPKN
jgi:hypothetical protein